MAWELVKDAANAVSDARRGVEWVPIPHLLRHDFESLFHVSFWSATGLKRPEDPDPLWELLRSYAEKQETGNLEYLGLQKHALCMNSLETNKIFLSEAVDKALKPWFMEWTLFFQNVYTILSHRITISQKAQLHPDRPQPPPFDSETIDGLFTRDTLKAALADGMPEGVTDEVLDAPLEKPDLTTDALSDAEEAPAKAKKGSKEGASKKTTKATTTKKDAKASGSKTTTVEPEKKSEESKRYCSKLRSSDKK